MAEVHICTSFSCFVTFKNKCKCIPLYIVISHNYMLININAHTCSVTNTASVYIVDFVVNASYNDIMHVAIARFRLYANKCYTDSVQALMLELL